MAQWANPNSMYAEPIERIELCLQVKVNDVESQNGPSPVHPRVFNEIR